ncbi:nucleoid occlusion protein [Carnobacterium gallinarum]|uniref:nucleoid occlusion protein n=1 Tax=Carnobacterium gallinarum TaxID=2749 RepID=UPI000556E2EB|nr:nucleoid occlusion protein [Carnobacterium gallinarum]
MALSDLFGSGKSKKKTEKLDEVVPEVVNDTIEAEEAHQKVQSIEAKQIVPNRFQPRKIFNEERLNELARTIHIHGLIQPIVIREYAPNEYEIIAGERRFRAMMLLEWETVPAIVQEMSDTETASVALIENLQREELTSIEEAKAYQGLIELNSITQEALAQRIGKSQSFVANKLRLLKLSTPVQQALLTQEISERHGRSLLALEENAQAEVLTTIITENLTVKETEEIVKKLVAEKNGSVPVKKKKRKKGISKDVRLALNTIKKSITMVTDTGIDMKTEEEDLEDVYRITIEIPKNKNQDK